MFEKFLARLKLAREASLLRANGFTIVTGARAMRGYSYWDIPLAGVPNSYATNFVGMVESLKCGVVVEREEAQSHIVVSDSSRRIWGIVGRNPAPESLQKVLDQVAISGESSDPDLKAAATEWKYYVGDIVNRR